MTDDQILSAYRMLANREGVFGEPASAASVAGLVKLSEQGVDFSGRRVVCVITGTGLKDPVVASQQTDAFLQELSLEPEDMELTLAGVLRESRSMERSLQG